MKLKGFSWVICIVIGLVVYLGDFRLLDDAENRFLDWQFRNRGTLAADSRIVIAGIDQETLNWAGRPMFAWGPLYAELTRSIANASASSMLLDLVFSPGSEGVIREHVKEIASMFAVDLPNRFYRELGFDKPFRSAMLEMIASGTSLIAGFAWENGQPVFSDPSLLHIAKKENTGYFNLATSADGVTRWLELFGQSSAGPVYAVSMVAAMRSGFAVKNLPQASAQYINFRGGRKNIKTISVHKIIEAARSGKSISDELTGKVILVGFTDITDFKATPFGFMPGVEVHANVLDNILNNRFLQPVSRNNEVQAIAVILFGLLLVARLHRLIAIAGGALLMILWAVGAVLWFDPLVIPVVRPLFLLIAFIVSESFLAYRAIYFDRRRVREVFSRYVSDSVVKEILASSDRDFLRGTRRRLCVLVADIRGFTTFSEQHDAHEVVEFLNAYFAQLTEIIMSNRGVVDKFLGDGILAFFNAPVEYANYADDALRSAQQIIAYTNSPEFKAICHGADLKVGVALHVGMAVFGNIGSARKAEFTIIGDTVNACSRMESLNKDYKTSLIVSGEVVKSVTMKTDWKFIEKTSLRGKVNEIEIYTINGMEGNNVAN